MFDDKKKKLAALIVAKAAPKPSADEVEPSGDEGLQAAADDLIEAVHARDSAGVVTALRAAFEQLGAEPVESDVD